MVDISEKQEMAIRYEQRLARRLIRDDSEELASLYRGEDPRINGYHITYAEVAELVIPDVYSRDPNVAKSAVGFAMREIIPTNELKELTKLRAGNGVKDAVARDPDGWSAQAREAWEVRFEKYGAPVEALTRGRGIEPWTNAAIVDLVELSLNPDFQRKPRYHKVCPDYSAITTELNRRHGQGREWEKVRHYMNRLRGPNRKRLERVLAEEDRLDLLKYL